MIAALWLQIAQLRQLEARETNIACYRLELAKEQKLLDRIIDLEYERIRARIK